MLRRPRSRECCAQGQGAERGRAAPTDPKTDPKTPLGHPWTPPRLCWPQGQSCQSEPNHPKMPFPKSSFRDLGFSFLGSSMPQTDPSSHRATLGLEHSLISAPNPLVLTGNPGVSRRSLLLPSPAPLPAPGAAGGMGWSPEGWDGGSWEGCNSRSHLSILLSKPFSPQP